MHSYSINIKNIIKNNRCFKKNYVYFYQSNLNIQEQLNVETF